MWKRAGEAFLGIEGITLLGKQHPIKPLLNRQGLLFFPPAS